MAKSSAIEIDLWYTALKTLVNYTTPKQVKTREIWGSNLALCPLPDIMLSVWCHPQATENTDGGHRDRKTNRQIDGMIAINVVDSFGQS